MDTHTYTHTYTNAERIQLINLFQFSPSPPPLFTISSGKVCDKRRISKWVDSFCASSISDEYLFVCWLVRSIVYSFIYLCVYSFNSWVRPSVRLFILIVRHQFIIYRKLILLCFFLRPLFSTEMSELPCDKSHSHNILITTGSKLLFAPLLFLLPKMIFFCFFFFFSG